MNRAAESYLRWLREGNQSEYLDRVRAVLDEEPRTRRELAELAGVSCNFAAKALDVLVALGEAERRTGRRRTRGERKRAKLYARRREEAPAA